LKDKIVFIWPSVNENHTRVYIWFSSIFVLPVMSIGDVIALY